jgi:transposase
MQPYSKEFRREVLAACDAGEGTQAVSLKFKVAESWVRRIKQQRRESGKVAPATTRNRIPKWRAIEPQIRAAIVEQPDLTLAELKAKLNTDFCVQTLCNALHALKLTLKKSPDRHRTGPSRRGRAAGQLARRPARSRSRASRVSR